MKVIPCARCRNPVRVEATAAFLACPRCGAITDAQRRVVVSSLPPPASLRFAPGDTLYWQGEAFHVLAVRCWLAGTRHVTEFVLRSARGLVAALECEPGTGGTDWLLRRPLATPPMDDGQGAVMVEGRQHAQYFEQYRELDAVGGGFAELPRRGSPRRIRRFRNAAGDIVVEEKHAGRVIWSREQLIDIGKLRAGTAVSRGVGGGGASFSTSKPAYRPAATQGQLEPLTDSAAVMIMALLFLVLGGVVQLALHVGARNEAVLTSDRIEAAAGSWTSQPFRLAGTGNLESVLTSTVDNGWLALELRLQNLASRRIYVIDQEVEFYRGTDFEGPWSEGSRSNTTWFSRVPPGEYQLQVISASDRRDVSFTLRLIRDTVRTDYFWLLQGWHAAWFLLLLVIAADKTRWSR